MCEFAPYYDPANSRFLSQDTYRGEDTNPQTLHLYAYTQNNPINFIDPSGHKGKRFIKKYKHVASKQASQASGIQLSVSAGVLGLGSGAIGLEIIWFGKKIKGRKGNPYLFITFYGGIGASTAGAKKIKNSIGKNILKPSISASAYALAIFAKNKNVTAADYAKGITKSSNISVLKYGGFYAYNKSYEIVGGGLNMNSGLGLSIGVAWNKKMYTYGASLPAGSYNKVKKKVKKVEKKA